MKPRARQEGIVVRELSDETLVYDLERHRAHCLNAGAARVWRLCDGNRSVEEIAAQLQDQFEGNATEVVWLALDQLARTHLLCGRIARPATRPRRSRREVVRRLGLGAALLPAVASILSPTVAEAAGCSAAANSMSRPDGCPCSNSGDCLNSHHCVGGKCGP